MKNTKVLKWVMLFTVIIILSLFPAIKTLNHSQRHPDNISSDENCLVTINGEKILKREIDLVYKQFENSEVQYEDIINNSIDEILVIQKAEDFGIEVIDYEVETQIQEYKEYFPDLYEEAVNIYGERELYKGQRNRIIYNKVKTYVMTNILGEDISDNVVNDFIDEYNLRDQLKDYTAEQIKNSLHKELEEYLFKNWIDNIRKDADIVFY